MNTLSNFGDVLSWPLTVSVHPEATESLGHPIGKQLVQGLVLTATFRPLAHTASHNCALTP
jgi:hypothetical protein